MSLENVPVSDEELRVMLETGFVLREAARFDEAEKIFRGVIEFLPESEVPQVGLATVYLQRGKFDKAEELCAEAMRINPESLYARVHYAEALLFNRERERAESELKDLIGQNPDSPHSQTAQALLDAADVISPQPENES